MNELDQALEALEKAKKLTKLSIELVEKMSEIVEQELTSCEHMVVGRVQQATVAMQEKVDALE